MTEHYVAIIDSVFLPQGLALHASLERHAGPYTLSVLCVDDDTRRILASLALPNVKVLNVADLETADLRQVKAGRSPREYCWTLKPFAPQFIFDAEPGAARVTYLDADLWLRKSLAPIFEELDAANGQVLITDHGYAPEYDSSATSGQYCAQFITFTRDGSEPVRSWWQQQCLEWCFARLETGRSGDQKYLDEWPERFPGRVHVLRHQGWTLAPWNATRFPYGNALLYHFQGLRLLGRGRVSLGEHVLPPPVVRHVYEPYLDCLRQAIETLRREGFEFRPQAKRPGLLEDARRALSALVSPSWRYRTRYYRKL